MLDLTLGPDGVQLQFDERFRRKLAAPQLLSDLLFAPAPATLYSSNIRAVSQADPLCGPETAAAIHALHIHICFTLLIS
jgi:hypothetical protein